MPKACLFLVNEFRVNLFAFARGFPGLQAGLKHYVQGETEVLRRRESET